MNCLSLPPGILHNTTSPFLRSWPARFHLHDVDPLPHTHTHTPTPPKPSELYRRVFLGKQTVMTIACKSSPHLLAAATSLLQRRFHHIFDTPKRALLVVPTALHVIPKTLPW